MVQYKSIIKILKARPESDGIKNSTQTILNI